MEAAGSGISNSLSSVNGSVGGRFSVSGVTGSATGAGVRATVSVWAEDGANGLRVANQAPTVSAVIAKRPKIKFTCARVRPL